MEPKLITNMHSRAIGALVLTFLIALVLASSSMPSAMAAAETGTAKSFAYNAQDANWLRRGDICADMVDDESHSQLWRSRYQWAEYAAEKGPYRGVKACFMCLEVTNAALGNDDSVIVRIVDIIKIQAGDPPILMDEAAFSQIDTDGSGNAAGGLLQVNYELIYPCPNDE